MESDCATGGFIQCTTSVMSNVSGCIGKDWKRLGRQLDLEETMLEDIEDRYRTYGFQEMAYQVLVIWQQHVGKEATNSSLQAHLTAIDRTDIISNYFHDSTSKLTIPIQSNSFRELKQTSRSQELQILKDVQEKLRWQYRDLTMNGLPWMEDVLLTLEDYYVDLSIWKTDRNGQNAQKSPTKIEDILNANDDEKCPTRVLVEGGPGLGKSTFAAKLAYDWATDKKYLKHFDLVLLIPLRYFVKDFVETISKATSIKDRNYIHEILHDKTTQLLLVLDGYDEASQETKNVVLHFLRNDLFSNVSTITTSRPGNFFSKLERLSFFPPVDENMSLLENVDFAPTTSYFLDRRIFIEGLTSAQQELFMKRHLSRYTEKQRLNIKAKLDMVLDSEFLKCPLFLLMLLVVFTNDSEHEIRVTSKTDLYKHVFTCVIRRYFSKVDNHSSPNMELFSSESFPVTSKHQLIANFSSFALWAIKNDCMIYTKKDILKYFDKRILDMGFLTQSVHVKGLHQSLVYEPVHKSLIEFGASYNIWLSFIGNDLDHWRTEAIALRPKIENSSSTNLCFPFLAGLMGTQVESLYTLLAPFESEYLSDFSKLVFTLLETTITDEVLGALKPFLPMEWFIPWLKPDNGFSVSLQHEAVVRAGALDGRIKFLRWGQDYPSLLPSDVEFETIVFNVFNPMERVSKVRCKHLWFTLRLMHDFNEGTFYNAHKGFDFHKISYNCIVMGECFPILSHTVTLKNLQVNWLKTNIVWHNTSCNYLLGMVIDLIKQEKIKKLALLIDGNSQQKQVDKLVKCAGKSLYLENFVLRSSKVVSTFYVDLTQLCNGGQKSWNWVQLEAIKVRCSRVIKRPVNIYHLDLGSSHLKLSVREKLRCCIASSIALSSSILSNPSGTWNLHESLEELNIVVEQSLMDGRLPSILSKLVNLKVLVLIMTAYEFKTGSMSVHDSFLDSHFILSLRRIELWDMELNQSAAMEIIESFSNFLEFNSCNNSRVENCSKPKAAVEHVCSSKLQLPQMLLNTILDLNNDIYETLSFSNQEKTFLRAICQLKSCLVKGSLPQLQIVRTYLSQSILSWMNIFPQDEGFLVQRDLWGSKQYDSIFSKGMLERSPGLLERISIEYSQPQCDQK